MASRPQKRASIAGPSGASRVTFELEEEDDDEADRDDEELVAAEDDDDELEEEELDPRAASNSYFTGHRKRKSTRLKSTLADLPGGEARDLAQRVHKMVSEEPFPAAVLATYAPQYHEWRSLLHGGSSLLLHGFGSKKRLLDDFGAFLQRHGAPADRAVEFAGHSLTARPRELMVELLQKLGLSPQGGGAAALCNQLRLAFANSAPQASAAPLPAHQAQAPCRAALTSSRPQIQSAGGQARLARRRRRARVDALARAAAAAVALGGVAARRRNVAGRTRRARRGAAAGASPPPVRCFCPSC